jgi:hypothetical protein
MMASRDHPGEHLGFTEGSIIAVAKFGPITAPALVTATMIMNCGILVFNSVISQ